MSKLVLDGDGGCRIEITRAPQARFLHATVHAGGTNVSQLSPAISDDLAALLSERLSRGANTALYFTLWRMARNWLAEMDRSLNFEILDFLLDFGFRISDFSILFLRVFRGGHAFDGFVQECDISLCIKGLWLR